jgi:putative transcriptional regulator
MVRPDVKTGNVLLAEPFMLDPNFKRAAVLLCEHNEEGSIGFIMNKPVKMSIDELIEDFPEFDSEVLFGGPVQTETLHYVHTLGDLLDDSMHITDDLYWGGDFEKLKFLISSNMIQPEQIRFFLGYSGWSEGQLYDELNLGSWIVADMDIAYLFDSEPEELWQEVMENKGSTFSVIAQIPEVKTWN